MDAALIEAIPNVSEGRDVARLDRCAAAIAGSGATLLDRTADWSHHRAVFTFAGERPTVEQAARALAAIAAAEIDLTAHAGVHPRIGALDVLPFVPLGSASMDDAIAAAHDLGRHVGDILGIPVFLYEAAARSPVRQPLEAVRRGGLAGLAARLCDPAWQPDYGPATLHPTAGAMAIGARGPLVAWNLVLDRADLPLAQHIARTVRASGGGLTHLKALGLALEHTGQVQVSMNLTNYRTTSMAEVFRAVDAEARRAGAVIADSEIIGLVPRAALADLAVVAPEWASRHAAQALEDRLTACGLPALSPASGNA
ncbi:MAG: glutamate formimidoyltransferase [Vicinamibacteraceae bacterium]